MSRRSRRRRSLSPPAVISRPERDLLTRSLTSPSRLLRDMAASSVLRMIEDRRQYHPLQFFRPARKISGHPVSPVRIRKAPPRKGEAFLAHRLNFAEPNRTLICVRRKQRKEVLHALKKVGRGRGRGAKRRNWYSNIGC